jgi:hypothetical protein
VKKPSFKSLSNKSGTGMKKVLSQFSSHKNGINLRVDDEFMKAPASHNVNSEYQDVNIPTVPAALPSGI